MPSLDSDLDERDRLALDTALRPSAPGIFETQIDRGWWVIQGPNGGYIAALLLRAMNQALGDPARQARSLTIHYTSPPEAGPARVETSIERSGRSLTTITARLLQGDKLRAIAIGALSTARSGPAFTDLRMPEAIPADRLEPSDSTFIPLNERYELRFLPQASRDAQGNVALTAAWIRPRPAVRPLDAELIAAYSDALPPAVFALADRHGPFGALPTIDLTVHFRNHAAWQDVGPRDFCLVVMRSRLSNQGFIEEDGEIWSPDGLLLAHSRQLALVLGT